MEQNKVQPSSTGDVINFGEWFLTIFLSSIPLVGIVLLFVWAFGSTTPPNKANWAKARLAWTAVGIAFSLMIVVIMFFFWGVAGRYS
jgi:hypothetical protein